jgi:hypothetical protein
MNIFTVDEDPVYAAQDLCDRHIVKQSLESAQMLCTTFQLQGIHAPYKSAHPNHPSTKWTRQTRDNFEWHVEHAIELCYEYTRRYNKIHASQKVIEWCSDNSGDIRFENTGIQPFPVAINHDKRCRQKVPNFDRLPVIMQYRWYYVYDKPFAKWTKTRECPKWFTEMSKQKLND